MRVLVTDWDETATVRDTTSLIASVPNRHDFSRYTEIYLQAYRDYDQRWGPRKTVEEEVVYQQGMDAVEMTSLTALQNDGYFKGIAISQFNQLAPKVELRAGFVDFIRRFDGPVYILSVNWCRSLIALVLELHGLADRKHPVVVLANQLEADREITTGRMDSQIRTGIHKSRELARIKKAHKLEIVYVGDSSTDILAILEADTGILISGGRARENLARVADVRPITSYTESASSVPRSGFTVFEASWPQLADIWIK